MSFIDIARDPDFVSVSVDKGTGGGGKLAKGPDGVWAAAGAGAEVRVTVGETCTEVAVNAPDGALSSVHLRWKGSVPSSTRFMADHWERAYGDMDDG